MLHWWWQSQTVQPFCCGVAGVEARNSWRAREQLLLQEARGRALLGAQENYGGVDGASRARYRLFAGKVAPGQRTVMMKQSGQHISSTLYVLSLQLLPKQQHPC
jgi:hypothetical protein